MKLKIVVALLLSVSVLAASPANAIGSIALKEKKYDFIGTKLFGAKVSVLAVEKSYSAIVKAENGMALAEALESNNIKGKNWGAKSNGKNKTVLARVILGGVAESSDKNLVKELIEGKSFDLECMTFIDNSYSGKLPVCQLKNYGNDIFILNASNEKYQQRLFLSTRMLNPEQTVHSEYEKAIGNLIMQKF